MPACRTRWSRCATAPWAGRSPGSPARAAGRGGRRTSPPKVSPGPSPPPTRSRAASASLASIARRSVAGARKATGARSICSTCAIRTNTRPGTCPAPPPQLRLDCAGLAALMARDEATIVDLSLSRDYLRAHIPGSTFAIRSRLQTALATIPVRGTLVLTSEDGVLAGLAVPEAAAYVDRPVRALDGGNAAWRAAGRPLTAADPRMADKPVDVWLKPYERPNDAGKAMSDYLAWEVDLLARIERDGSTNFLRFGP